MYNTIDQDDIKNTPGCSQLNVEGVMNVQKNQQIYKKSSGIVNSLPDGAFTATSTYQDKVDLYGAQHARIGAPQKKGCSLGWIAKQVGDSLIVDLCDSYIVSGVATQCRGDAAQWVSQYSIQTSQNGLQWKSQGEFLGNFDAKTVVKRKFKYPVIASFVKITTMKFHSHPTMRIDILCT